MCQQGVLGRVRGYGAPTRTECALRCRANRLLEETAPWTALKKGSDEEKAAAGVTLVAALEGTRIVAVLLAPVVPALSQRILAQLGLSVSLQVPPCTGHALPAVQVHHSHALGASSIRVQGVG